jgi:hypothetical protein
MFAVKHCRVSVLAVNSIGIIFKIVNMADKQRAAGQIADPEHTAAQHLLSFSEFAEAVIRLAHVHASSNKNGAPKAQQGATNVGELLSHAFGEFMELAALHALKLPADTFRRDVFQAEQFRDAITDRNSWVSKWHASCNVNGHRGSHVLSLKDFITALEAAGWIDGYRLQVVSCSRTRCADYNLGAGSCPY